MKKIQVLLPLMGLLVYSCGGDVGSRTDAPETTTPTATAEENHTVASQLPRSKGSTVLSSLEEISNIVNGTLSQTNYRTIPNMAIDDEGSSVNVTLASRPALDCGNTIELGGINNRIAACAKAQASTATWDGIVNGHAGESVWKLVYNNTLTAKEVWLDTKTGHVWSDLIDAGNWCQASGNKQTISDVAGVDCETEAGLVNLCTNLTVPGLASNVTWRLPTRNDYLQAELDGIRFVLKSSTQAFWTATVQAASAHRNMAWTFQPDGSVAALSMLENRPVRCIGAPVR